LNWTTSRVKLLAVANAKYQYICNVCESLQSTSSKATDKKRFSGCIEGDS